jgi:hypothetical protein
LDRTFVNIDSATIIEAISEGVNVKVDCRQLREKLASI